MDTASDLRLRRAERRIELLDRLVEERNRDLAITQEQASAVQAYLVGLNNVLPGAMIGSSPGGTITRANRGVQDLLGHDASVLAGTPLARLWPAAADFIRRCLAPGVRVIRDEAEWVARDGHVVPVLVSGAPHRDLDGRVLSLVFVALDVSERRRLEVELRHAQKLESLGQLSAGVAHEINTPMQYLGDNLHFIRDAIQGLLPLLSALDGIAGALPAADAAALREQCRQADLDFVRQRLPRSIDSALDGVARVTHIVEAMRSFSHPQSEKTLVDLNKGLLDTLTVARNAYKYVAEVVTDLGELPMVICNGGDLNQAFLNLIVNAAQAIAQRQHDGDPRRGTIRIGSRREGADVVIDIVDDGVGIPESIRHRIFDPFFTTKEVGKGTGQGLSISRSIVVDHHHGSLTFDSEVGRGTRFTVRLPIAGAPHEAREPPSSGGTAAPSSGVAS